MIHYLNRFKVLFPSNVLINFDKYMKDKKEKKEIKKSLDELKIVSVLDCETYNKMSRDEISGFIIREVNEMATMFSNPELDGVVRVICNHTLIDSRYNHMGKLVASADYTNKDGAKLLGFKLKTKNDGRGMEKCSWL